MSSTTFNIESAKKYDLDFYTLTQDVNAAIAAIKVQKSIQFVDWCPTGFKVCHPGFVLLFVGVCLFVATIVVMH